MQTIPCRTLLIVILGFQASLCNAEKLEPPSEVLHSPLVNVTATEFVEVAAFGHVVFRLIKQLSGRDKAPELIDLLVAPDLIPKLKPGSRQLIAWSAIGGDPRVPEGMRRDPSGARLLMSTGLEPALFEDTRENRELLRWDLGESHARQRAQLPRLLKLLDSREAAVQLFAIAEIALRPVLVEALDDAARKRLRSYAVNSQAPENARALLIELASQRTPALGNDGWDEVVDRVLTQTPIETASEQGRANLVMQTFALARSREMPVQDEKVERWLRSDSAGLAEAALLTLRRVAPEREAVALEQTLARADVPPLTRTFLVDHQRRLSLMSAPSH
jgi:hypothetical protein